jgi:hypothetical protein|eukprot:COSAG03_NODE_52_length_16230_cov_22.987168_18_plen_43_part_00
MDSTEFSFDVSPPMHVCSAITGLAQPLTFAWPAISLHVATAA